MPRPCKCRWIGTGPEVTAFKPCGVPGRLLDTVELRLDELEAVRLADLEGLYQDAAAERMGVSRATFGRLVASARHKIASALLGSKMLVIQGGSVMMRNMRTFACAGCGAEFQAPYGTGRPQGCPACGSMSFRRAADDRGDRAGAAQGRGRCRRHRARARSGRSMQQGLMQQENAG